MDLWYIDHWSLWLDAKIVFMTFGELFRAEPEPIEDELNIERAHAADANEPVREVPADEWDALLAGLALPDAYLLRAYVESACVLDPGEPVLLHLADGGGDVVLACIVREIPDAAARDVTTPYGYGGPVGVGDEPPVAAFYEQYEGWCAGRGVVSTFVRFHPLFANHRRRRPRPCTSSAPARPPPGGSATAATSSRACTAATATSAGRPSEPESRSRVTCHPEDLTGFAALYDTTMQRQQATDFYFFPPAYWERLTALGDRLVLFDATVDEQVVASTLCLRDDRWLHYHLSATADSARDLGASNLLLYEAASWGQEQGLDEFHLGGGAGSEADALLAFKQRFSPDGAREFWVGKLVHDEDAYRRLSGDAEIDYDGFFPAYRA